VKVEKLAKNGQMVQNSQPLSPSGSGVAATATTQRNMVSRAPHTLCRIQIASSWTHGVYTGIDTLGKRVWAHEQRKVVLAQARWQAGFDFKTKQRWTNGEQ